MMVFGCYSEFTWRCWGFFLLKPERTLQYDPGLLCSAKNIREILWIIGRGKFHFQILYFMVDNFIGLRYFLCVKEVLMDK